MTKISSPFTPSSQHLSQDCEISQASVAGAHLRVPEPLTGAGAEPGQVSEPTSEPTWSSPSVGNLPQTTTCQGSVLLAVRWSGGAPPPTNLPPCLISVSVRGESWGRGGLWRGALGGGQGPGSLEMSSLPRLSHSGLSARISLQNSWLKGT